MTVSKIKTAGKTKNVKATKIASKVKKAATTASKSKKTGTKAYVSKVKLGNITLKLV